MAGAVCFEIFAYQGRTIDYIGTLLRADGVTPLVLATSDLLRFKYGRGTAVPILDMKSGVQSAAGSTITITSFGTAAGPNNVPPAVAATYDLHLAQGDMILPGCYDCEIIVVDAVETLPVNAMKEVSFGILHIIETLGGAIGP